MLETKLTLLARLLRCSRYTVVVAGVGISTQQVPANTNITYP